MAARIIPTDDLRRILDQEQDAPVFLLDVTGEATHVAVPVEEARRWFDEYLRRELQVGFEQADAGQIEPWDIEATIAEARRRFAERSGA